MDVLMGFLSCRTGPQEAAGIGQFQRLSFFAGGARSLTCTAPIEFPHQRIYHGYSDMFRIQSATPESLSLITLGGLAPLV